MDLLGEMLHRRRAQLARSLVVAALLCAAYLLVDATQPRAREIVAWRGGWVLLLLAAAAAQRWCRPGGALAAAHLVAAFSGIATVAIFRLAGGSSHAAFGFVLALPLVIQVLCPELPTASALAGLATVAGGTWTLIEEGRSGRDVAEWALVSIALSTMAGVAAVSFRRVWMRELQSERARRATLERLANAERLAAVGRLSAGVAHEINNPLSFVSANLQFARDELATGAPSDAAREALDEALSGIQRVTGIVRELRIIGRPPDAPAGGSADLGQVLAATLRIAGNDLRQRGRLVQALAPGLVVRGDEVRLGQVFLNLLVNAVQALPLGRPEENSITLTARQEAGEAVVLVSDTGCGIAAGDLPRIFDPFFTTKAVGEGTGLGLSLSKGMVEELGGSIHVVSAPGVGSTFRVTLRLVAADREQPSAA